MAFFNQREGYFVVSCLAATALVILAVHILRLLLMIWIGRLRSLDNADQDLLPPLKSALIALATQAGIAQPPRVLIRSGSRTEAFTFGNWFGHYLCLDAGLVFEFFTRRNVFDAKIRYELAHFRNKDINKAGLTTASWWTFVTITPAVFELPPISLDTDLSDRRQIW